ncbi:MAG: DICT sensory domain-containing protein, partial [Gordonia paraffinivorans]
HSMIVIGTFQHKRHFTTETSRRWHLLSEATGFAGVYGVGLEDRIEGNVQHAPLEPEDDLVNEWTVAVLGPHYAALLSARDLHDNGPDLDRTFDFVQSFDRVTVTQAVNSILSRFTG